MVFATSAGPDPVGPTALERTFADELARLRAEATAAGYADGHAQGLAHAAGQVEAAAAAGRAQAQASLDAEQARARSAAAALTAAVDRFAAVIMPTTEEMAHTLTVSAFALAEAIIGRELDASICAAADAVARAARLCPADGPVTVRVHPEDLAEVRAHGDVLDDRFTLVADPSVERGGAVAAFGATEVDAQIGAALARAKATVGA